MESISVASFVAAFGLVAAVHKLVKSIAGDLDAFSRRRLRRIDACVASVDPTRPLGRFAAALREEEAFRQLMGVAPTPRIATLMQALYETGEFTQRELVHAIRQLPYDAKTVDDKRNRGNAIADIVGGILETALGLFLIGFSVVMLDEAKVASDYAALAGCLIAGLLIVGFYGGAAIRGKHSLDAIKRVSEALSRLESSGAAIPSAHAN